MKISRREFLQSAMATTALAATPGFLAACARDGANLKPTKEAAHTGFGNVYFAQKFGVTEAMIQKVFRHAMAKGGDFADIFFEHTTSADLVLEDGQVNRGFTEVQLGAGIRVVKGNRFGFAFTEELTLESMIKAAQTASAIADAASTYQPAPISLGVTPDYYPIKTVMNTVGLETKIPYLQKVNERIFAADRRIVKAKVHYFEEAKQIMIARTDGLVVEDFQPQVAINASAVAEQEGRKEKNYFSYAGREGESFFTEQRLNRLGDNVVRRTVQLFEAVQPPAGEMPVVLGPGASGILLHEAIGHGMEADFNRKKVSIFSEMMGKNVAIDEVTIYDDATVKNARGAINVDDEGNEGKKTALVERGVLASYMHDRISAAHYGVAPTGSGRRQNFHYAPMPRMRATYMENGPHTPEDIIKSVKKGLYAEVFRNGAVKIGEGSFSFYVASGNMIEDGKLTAPVKDINIIGNGPAVLAKIAMVGNDTALDVGGWTCGKDGQRVPVSQGLPTTLVSSITVGGARQG